MTCARRSEIWPKFPSARLRDLNASFVMTSADNATQLTVLFATETGNAEDIAYRIADIALRHHVPTRICDLHDYDRVRVMLTSTLVSNDAADRSDQRVIHHICSLNNGEW